MAQPQKQNEQPLPIPTTPLRLRKRREEDDLGFQEREEDKDPANSREVFNLLGDVTCGPARFAQWLDSVRSRSGRHPSPNFRYRDSTPEETMPFSSGEQIAKLVNSQHSEQASEISLWERLSRASVLDIDSSEFSWDMLSSLHRTEHSCSTDYSEDELNKPLEVTVNSGGVVFFALFNRHVNDDSHPKEAAAVIKICSSKKATQSERFGYEFAKVLGVSTPQARVIHNSSDEWQQMKDAAEKTRDAAITEGDEIGEETCSELLEALEFSRCLFIMKCKHKLILNNMSCNNVAA